LVVEGDPSSVAQAASAGGGHPGTSNSCGGKKEMKNKTKKETFYVVRCKSTGNFWYESLDDFYCMEELDHHSFEDSPLGAVRVGQDPGDFEEELEVIKKYLPKGEFDASDFELVKVDVSYTLSRP
jgi:hypothetical protein